MVVPVQLPLPLGGFPSPIRGKTYAKEEAYCLTLSGTAKSPIAQIFVLQVAPECYIQAWDVNLGSVVHGTPLKAGPVLPCAEQAVLRAARAMHRYAVQVANSPSASNPSPLRVRQLRAWVCEVMKEQTYRLHQQPGLFA